MSEGYGIDLFYKLVTDILNIFGLKKNLDKFEVFNCHSMSKNSPLLNHMLMF